MAQLDETALIDEAKVHLRVVTDMTDDEIATLVRAAIDDMRRLGVRESVISGSMSPTVKMAVMFYCKAHYGYDNSEAMRFDNSYRMAVTNLMHSEACEPEEDDG